MAFPSRVVWQAIRAAKTTLQIKLEGGAAKGAKPLSGMVLSDLSTNIALFWQPQTTISRTNEII